MLRLRITAAALLLILAACGRGADKALPETSVVKGINFVGIVVDDIDSATDFYVNSTDLKLVDSRTLENSPALDTLAQRSGVTADARLLRTVNGQVQLMSFDTSAPKEKAVPVQGPGIAHICHQVDQETRVYNRFLENRGTVIGDPELIQLNPRNPVFYGYLKDLDGAVVEVEHVDVAALKLDTPPPNQYRMRHVALATPDIDRLADFYSELLDQPNPRRIGGSRGFSGKSIDGVSGLEGARLKMAWFQVRNMELEISQFTSHPTTLPNGPRPVDAPGYNMIVLDVSDLAAAVDKFITAGGTIVTEQEDFNGGPIVFGRDLDGNLIGLQAAAPDSYSSSQNFSGNGT